MPIDLAHETTKSLTDAASGLPRGRSGARPNLSTLIRWITAGTVTPDGRRVRLEAVRLGGKWITSVEALQRYAEALTPRLDGEPEPAPRTLGQRERANAAAKRRLAAQGM